MGGTGWRLSIFPLKWWGESLLLPDLSQSSSFLPSFYFTRQLASDFVRYNSHKDEVNDPILVLIYRYPRHASSTYQDPGLPWQRE